MIVVLFRNIFTFEEKSLFSSALQSAPVHSRGGVVTVSHSDKLLTNKKLTNLARIENLWPGL